MWRLVTRGGRLFPIDELPAMLGSGADNEVRLRHASILPQHARLDAAPDGRLAVLALGEAVVGIGGRRVERGALDHGDELVLGRLRFTVERAEQRSHGAARSAPAQPALRARRPAAAGPRAAARQRAPAADQLVARNDKTLTFSRKPERRGPLDVDFAQLSGAWKAIVVAALLVVGAGLFYGVALLTGLLG